MRFTLHSRPEAAAHVLRRMDIRTHCSQEQVARRRLQVLTHAQSVEVLLNAEAASSPCNAPAWMTQRLSSLAAVSTVWARGYDERAVGGSTCAVDAASGAVEVVRNAPTPHLAASSAPVVGASLPVARRRVPTCAPVPAPGHGGVEVRRENL